jgi:hypothetical protein
MRETPTKNKIQPVLHSEIQPKRRYDLKSENLEIRLFLAVLGNTAPRFKKCTNIIVILVHAKFEMKRIRPL